MSHALTIWGDLDKEMDRLAFDFGRLRD